MPSDTRRRKRAHCILREDVECVTSLHALCRRAPDVRLVDEADCNVGAVWKGEIPFTRQPLERLDARHGRFHVLHGKALRVGPHRCLRLVLVVVEVPETQCDEGVGCSDMRGAHLRHVRVEDAHD
jgi:hypothetical protein